MLKIIEIYASVQGETSFTGLPTTFIRLAACNLRCTWCDSPYTFGRGKPLSLEEILDQTRLNGTPYVCITGGEPLLQTPVLELMRRLCDEHFVVSLETSGSLPIAHVDRRVHVILDVKCPGSGMENRNHWENMAVLMKKDEVKFVIKDRADFDYAKDICQKHRLTEKVGQILFSPVHGELDPRLLIEWMLADKLPYRLNLQMHKYVWEPATRGV